MTTSGCTGGSAGPTPSTSDSHGPVYGDLLAIALETPNLDPGARELLEGSRDAGKLTYEELKTAAALYVSCLTDQGLVARSFDQTVEGRDDFTFGAIVPDTITTDQDEANEYLNGALASYQGPLWTPIEQLYASQNSSVEAREAHFAQYRPSIVSCLEAADFDVPDRATEDAILHLVYQASDEDNVECLLDTGYYQNAAIPPNWWLAQSDH